MQGMNPYQAIMGGMGAQGGPSGFSGIPGTMPGLGGLFGQAQQLAGILRNPQGLVARFFPDAPQEVTGDPDSLLQWMQQAGRVNPQMVQMVRQMVGR